MSVYVISVALPCCFDVSLCGFTSSQTFRSGLGQVLHQRVLLVARRAVGAQLRVRVVLERRQLHAEVLQVRTARDDVRVVLLST